MIGPVLMILLKKLQKLKGLGYMLIYTVWKEILEMRLTGIPERVDQLSDGKIWLKNGKRLWENY